MRNKLEILLIDYKKHLNGLYLLFIAFSFIFPALTMFFILGDSIGDVIFIVYAFLGIAFILIILSLLGFMKDKKLKRLIEQTLSRGEESEGQFVEAKRIRISGGKRTNQFIYRITYSFFNRETETTRLCKRDVQSESLVNYLQNKPFKVIYSKNDDIYLLVR